MSKLWFPSVPNLGRINPHHFVISSFARYAKEPPAEYFTVLGLEKPFDGFQRSLARDEAMTLWRAYQQNRWVVHGYICIDRPEILDDDECVLFANLTDQGSETHALLRRGFVIDFESAKPSEEDTLAFWRTKMLQNSMGLDTAHQLAAMAGDEHPIIKRVFQWFVLYRLCAETRGDFLLLTTDSNPIQHEMA